MGKILPRVTALSLAVASGMIGWGIYYTGLYVATEHTPLSNWAQVASLLLMLSGLFAFFDLFRNTFKGGMRGLTLAALVLCGHLIVLAINGYLRLLY